MPFDVRSFALQVRPSPKRPSPPAFDGSVLDAGSPQYVRPEDLFLDIQSRLFGLSPRSGKDLGGIDPSDFRTRWLKEAVSELKLQRVGQVGDEQLADAVMTLLRCPQRKKERHRTLLPILPTIGLYKNIKPNLPHFLNDQFRPALSFGDDNLFDARVTALKDRLFNGLNVGDGLRQLSACLLPLPKGGAAIGGAAFKVQLHEGPLLKNFSFNPSMALSVCSSLGTAIDSFVILEEKLPRILWTRWLTAALRLWLPLFFLKRCSVTARALQQVRESLVNGSTPSVPDLSNRLVAERAVLRGSRGWLNQLAPVIQNYVRARFELTVLLELTNIHARLIAHGIDPANAGNAAKVEKELEPFAVTAAKIDAPLIPPAASGILAGGKKLSMPGDASGHAVLPLDKWMKWLVANKAGIDGLARIIGGLNAVDLADKVYSHVRPDYEPLKSGFGKNAYEYVAFVLGAPRKVDRDPEFPDEFNLIYRAEGGRRARHVMVQPGPQLLGMLVQLVSHQARASTVTFAKFGDLLDLFSDIGVDFRSNPDDFEGLKFDLLRLGLLQSSADAAEAATLKPPYSI